jgi:hypothetical protein
MVMLQNRLLLSAILFGVLWTAGMIWWTGTDTVNVVGTTIAGIVAAILWYFVMRWWVKRRA